MVHSISIITSIIYKKLLYELHHCTTHKSLLVYGLKNIYGYL